jgi:hypothetical protein
MYIECKRTDIRALYTHIKTEYRGGMGWVQVRNRGQQQKRDGPWESFKQGDGLKAVVVVLHATRLNLLKF